VSDNLAKKYYKSLAWNQLRQFILYPLTFLLSIVLARGLGANNYGIYVGLIAIKGILELFSSLGFEGVSSISLAQMQPYKEQPKASYFIRKLLIIRILVTLLTLCIFLLTPKQLCKLIVGKNMIEDGGLLIIVVAIYFFIANLNLLSMSFYKGLLRFKRLCFIDIISYSASLILCILVLNFTKNLNIVFGVLIFTQIAIAILYFTGLKSFLIGKSTKFNFKKINSLSINLFATRIAQYALGYQKDLLLIGFFLQDPKRLAFYHIASRLAEAFNSLLTLGFGEVTLPSFSETYFKKGKEGLNKIWLTFIKLEIILTFPSLIFAIANGRHIIQITYSEQFLQAVPAFQLFCAMMLLSNGFLGGGTNQKVLYAMNKQSLVLLVIVIAGLLNIIIAIALIPRHGIIGAAIATCLAVFTWRFSEFLISVMLIKAKFPFLFTCKIITATLISYYSISQFIRVTGIFSIIVSGLVFSLIYIGVLYIVKPLSNEDLRGLSNINQKLVKYANFFSINQAKP